MLYIQCFGLIGANIVDVDEAFVQANTTKFQTYIPYDEVKHANFTPRDVLDPKSGDIDSSYRLSVENAEKLGQDADKVVAKPVWDKEVVNGDSINN